MLGGMEDAIRGCRREEMRMDVITNNLANSGVVGFKRERISFNDALRVKTAEANTGGGSGDSNLVVVQTDLEQGDSRFTGNPLDLAIVGDGFFKVETERGTRFTRKGDFSLNEKGEITTQAGDKVMGEGGAIVVNGNTVTINARGAVKVDGVEVGKLDIVDFENYGALVKEGAGFFRNDTDEPEIDPEEMTVSQEYLELANVNTAEEMIQMIHCMRAFESYQKSIKILDELNQKAINDVSSLK